MSNVFIKHFMVSSYFCERLTVIIINGTCLMPHSRKEKYAMLYHQGMTPVLHGFGQQTICLHAASS